ncbi:MAG: hypothetical protein HRU69_02520 [Flammeovirgaceae bacterium]|nr:MAG: hypothetical protein HRU69_02520 [Flammeovirgaceae bacterium]
MKKLFALLMVCGFAFAFAACGGKKAEEATTEPATEETAPAQEAAPADSTAADSTAAQ